MKKTIVGLIGLCIGLITISPAYADNDSSLPKLQMRIVNTIKNQSFALCLSNSCYVMTALPKPVSMDGNNIDSIIMTNTGTMEMYGQNIPDSCKITVKDNQTLTVSGKLVAKEMTVEVEDLQCSVRATEAA
ncbi:MAG: hypothetical protein V4501_12400 [Pseudomonadota bacterium]